MEEFKRIGFAGPSGIGKTTLAKWISEEYKIPFISSSYSDLIPETKNITHEEMVNMPLFMKEYQLLNKRRNLYAKQDRDFVTDRCYIDSVAYMINKLSHKHQQCDMDTFIEQCKVLLFKQFTHIIYIPFTIEYFDTRKWNMEDNGKRITNRYYQYQISLIMDGVIKDIMGYNKSSFFSLKSGGKTEMGNIIDYEDKSVNILILRDITLDRRKNIIKSFLR